MANQEKVTIREALEITAGILERITIPISMMDDVGMPVRSAIGNLRECIRAIDADEARKQNGPQIEVEEAGTVDELPEGAEVIPLNPGVVG